MLFFCISRTHKEREEGKAHPRNEGESARWISKKMPGSKRNHANDDYDDDDDDDDDDSGRTVKRTRRVPPSPSQQDADVEEQTTTTTSDEYRVFPFNGHTATFIDQSARLIKNSHVCQSARA